MAESGRGALVTGAGHRIGRGIALALAADGWRTVVHYNASAAEAAAVVAEIEAAGGRAAAVGADLADPAAAEGLVAAAANTVGPLGCLVNNASLFAYDSVDTFTADGWDSHMAVNLRAPALLARRFAAGLPDGTDGVVVNLIDQKVVNLNADFFSYTVSKLALEGLTRLLAVALAPHVRVCGIAPGLTLPSADQPAVQFARVHDETPLGRGSTVADIVTAVRYVLSAASLTGQTIVVDGGQHLQPRARDVMFQPIDGGAEPAPGG